MLSRSARRDNCSRFFGGTNQYPSLKQTNIANLPNNNNVTNMFSEHYPRVKNFTVR